MSPYLTEEGSTESGRPVNLYQFTVDTTIFRYTSAAQDVIADAQTWTAIPGLKRGKIQRGVERRNQTQQITLPGDNEFVQLFTNGAPSFIPIVEIFNVHLGDLTDVVRIWKGEVTDITWGPQAARASVAARSLEAAMDAQVPRRDCGIQCPYQHYDTDCTVPKSGVNQFSGTISAPTGNFVTVSGLDVAKGVGWATAGSIKVGTEERVILDHGAVDTLELGSPFQADVTNAACDVFAGCDHSLDGPRGCTSFNNEDNYGGNAFVPLKDIHRSGVN